MPQLIEMEIEKYASTCNVNNVESNYIQSISCGAFINLGPIPENICQCLTHS